MENTTSGSRNIITNVLLHEAAPKLAWLPHVILSIIMITLLALSFVNFHLKYKDRYMKRTAVARQVSSDSINLCNSFTPQLETILADSHRQEIASSSSQEPNGAAESNYATKTSQKGETLANHSQAEHEVNTIVDAPMVGMYKHSSRGGQSPDSSLNLTPFQFEMTPNIATKLNDRQCLTFEKRDSRQNFLSSESTGLSHTRWLPIRKGGWRLTKSPSRNRPKTPAAERTGILSYMSSRLRDGESRPISVNMWASGARRHRDSRRNKPNCKEPI